MFQVLVKLLSIASDAGFEFLAHKGLQGIASIKTFLKSIGPAGEFIIAAFDEHPVIATIAFFAGTILSFFLGPPLAALIGTAAVSSAFGSIGVAVFTALVGAAVDITASTLLTVLGVEIAAGLAPQFETKFLGTSFSLKSDDPRIASGETAIGTIQDPLNNAIYTTYDKIPPNGNPVDGRVDISLVGSQFIQLEKGTFSQLVNTGKSGLATPLFTAFLQNKNGDKSGSLKLNPQTNDVSVTGTDGSVVKLKNLPLVNLEASLKVTQAESGGTLVSVLDNGDGSRAGQVLVDVDQSGNAIIGSNLANQTITLGSGIDTLLHVGAGSVIDAGGNFDPTVGHATGQFELSVTKNTLVLGSSNGESISLRGGFVQTGGSLDGSSSDTSLIVANGKGQIVNGGSGNNIVIAAGTNDTLNASQSGQKLIALGQSGDVLNGQTTNTGGLDKLIALAGTVVGGNVSNIGKDTLNAGVGNNIMIGEGVDTTFNIDTTKSASPIDVVWATGGTDTLNVTGAATVYVVDAPDATLASVKNLNIQKLYQELISKIAIITQVFGKGPEAPTSGPAIIAINPTPNEKLVVNGQQITTGQGGPSRSTIVDFVSITGEVQNLAGPVVGLAPGDFGISINDPNGTTPKVSLANFQNQASANASGGSGGGTDPSVVDQSTISGFDISDTLLSISAATITQFSATDTLIAANGADTLIDNGSNDTLFGNAAGSTLIGKPGNPAFFEIGTVAAYTANGVTVDLAAGTASITGASASDTLFGIQNGEVLGTNDVLIAGGGTSTLISKGADDTLIGGAGTTTLVGSVNGSTLIAGSGTTVVDYGNIDANVVVNLATQTATSSGSSASDTLVGIQVAVISAAISGRSDTLIGGAGNDTLTAAGFFGTVIGGTGNDTLTASGEFNTLIGGSGNDVLTITSSGGFDTLIGGAGADTLSSAGAENVLIGGSGQDVLTSTGFSSLVAGAAADTLISTGFDDTLVGNALGSTLIAQAGKLAVAVYNANNLTVDLNAGTATVNGSSTSDTLINISAVTASGDHDTLLGGSAAATLTASGTADTVIAGSGVTTIGATSGAADVLVGGSGNTTIFLTAGVVDNTLIGGSGSTTLDAVVGGNTLIAGTGSTTVGYGDNGDVVDLAIGTASLSGSPSDTLIGITSALISGQGSTLIGGGAGDILSAVSAEGSHDILIAGSGNETLTSSGLNSFINTCNTLIAGSGSDTLSSSGSGDLLIAGNGAFEVLSSSGRDNSLVAGSGIDTLTSTGSNDTLFGSAIGSTLDGRGGLGAIAAYTANDVTVNLASGIAGINGSGEADTLSGITAAAAFGTNDTLIDGNGGSTLISNANGNTLEGGTGETVASYATSNLTINLATGVAGVNGAGLSDTLIGIHAASVAGSNNTVIGDGGTDVLSAAGTGNTLLGGACNDTLTATGTSNVLIADGGADALILNAGTGNTLRAGAGSDTLTSNGGTNNTLVAGSGPDTLASSGTGDSLVAGSGADVLSSTGTNNTLFAGTGVSTLSSSGSGDTLFGSGNGSTLNATGFGASVVYSLDNITVDLATGTAGANGSSVADTLSGFNTAAVLGSNDTLIDGNSGSTLVSNGGGNTLVGGTGRTVAAYVNNSLAVNLATGTANVNGSSVSDTLIGIEAIAVSGSNDTVTGDSGTDILSSSGSGNTLIAGTGVDTLSSTGIGDTLFGNLLGSTLEQGFNAAVPQNGTVAAYAVDNATINLSTGTAQANGSNVSDQLFGISTVEALGSNDTLIGSANVSTLISNAGGNTLIGQVGAETIALYENDNLTVNLVAGTAEVNGTGVADTLIGIMAVDALGNDDTLISGGTGNTLTARNASDVVAYAVDNLSINLTALAIGSDANGNTVVAGTAGVNGTNAEDRLVNVSNVLVSGTGDSVTGGMTSDSMTAAGSNDILIAGAVSDVLIASGTDDTLAGNFTGSTLQATQTATGTVALYAQDVATIDLGAGTASSIFSTASDTLIGITNVSVTGAFDTVLAGDGADTLSSSGSFNSLVGGSGADVLESSGESDILIAGSVSQTLLSQGTGNTLIAGSAADLLTTTGSGDTLVGNALGSTLNGTGGTGAVAAYTMDNVTFDLATGTASVNGSGVADTLIGISSAAVSGTGDIVIAGSGASVLISNGSGNTLIGGGGADTLSSSGSGDTLMGGSGTDLLTSSGSHNSLIAGNGADVLASSGTGDVLQGGSGPDSLSSNGTANTLVAGSGVDILSSTGTSDTLFGNGAGSTLIGINGIGTVAAYAINDVTIDLVTGTASVNGTAVSDSLLGISSVLLTGSGDTVIGGTGAATIFSDGAGNTIVAGTGQTTVAYRQDSVTVNLASGMAFVEGSTTSDTLVGITRASASGSGDTLIGDAGNDILSSGGTSNTLIAGGGSDTLSSSGFGDTLLAGAGTDVLTSSGEWNELVAGAAADLLISTGISDILVGNAEGSTLDGSAAFGAVAAYTIDNVVINLATGTAAVKGSNVSDALIGITSAMAEGTDETLIGGSGSTTLFGNAGGNTLVAGAGETVAAYVLNGVTVNLATRTAEFGGSSDTLVGISIGLVSGIGDVLIGGGDGNILSSSGVSNTLIAGAGAEMLSSSGFGDTLYGNAAGSTLDGSGGASAVAAYTQNNVTINLAAGTAAINGLSISDTLIGIESVTASGNSDTVIGDANRDVLAASGSDDIVIAGSGIATLVMKSGTNTYVAGTGVDTFVVQSATVVSGLNQPQNLISNFDASKDTIDLTNITGVHALSDLQFSTVTFGSQSYLEVVLGNSGDVITLAGISAGQLAAADFVFAAAPVTVGPTIIVTSAVEASNVANQTITGAVTAGGAGTVVGQTVTLIDNGATLGTATVQSDGSFSANVILLNQGANSIVASVTDSLGNAGSSTAVVDTLDNIPPPVTITSAAEASNVSAQTITGTVVSGGAAAVVGQTVTLFDNGATLGTATVQSDGSFSANVILPNQGANSIVASVTDSLGNTGSSTAVVDTLDNVPPTVTITSAAEASKNASQTITGTVTSGGAAVVVGQTVTLTDNGATLGTAIVQANGSFSANVTLPNQGSNSIVATVTDSFGDIGASTAVIDTLDSIPPTVTITSAAEASKNASQTITGTVTSGGAAAVVGQTVTLTDNGTTLATATVQANGSFSANVTLPNQGANSIVATVTDSFGNTGTSSAVVDTLDNVPPTVTITSAAEASKNASQTITGTVVSGGAAAVVGQTVTLTDNGATLGTAIVQANGSFSANVTLLNQGSNSIFATVTDSFGNVGASAAVVDVLDNVPPTVTITSAAEASKNAGQTITGTVVSGGAAAVVGQTVTLTDNGATLGTAIVQANGSFSANVTLPNQGSNSIVATVTDSFGNIGTSAAVVDVLDNVSPTVTITSTAEASKNASQTITGTVTSGGAAAVVGQTVTLTDNGATLGTAIVQANGSFSANVTLPNQGSNSIVATVSDSFGNTGTSAAVVDVLDNVPPTVAITSAAESSQNPNQTIAGTVTSGGAAAVVGQTVTLKDNGTTLGTAVVQMNGTFSANVTLPNPGSNSIVATVTDSFGNTGTSAAVVDTLIVGPTVTITSAAEASKTASQTITGTVVPSGTGTVVGKTVTLKDNGTTLGTTTVQTNGTFSLTVTLPFQGANSIVASVTDSNGKTGTSAPVVDTLDNVAPTVKITSAAEASKNASQTITGAVTSGGAAAVVGQTVTLKDNGTTLATAVVQADGTFSANVTLPNQGSNSLVATVTDSFGNVGTSTAVVDTLDNVAPTVKITSAAEASKNASQTITGTVTSGGAAAVVGQTVTLTDNGATLGTAVVQSGGTFSTTVMLPNQGSNSIVATVTDSFGNVGTSAAVVDTLDNVPPTVKITSAAEASRTASQTITGTVVSGGAAVVVGKTVTLTDNGKTLGTAVVQSNGTFSATVTLPNQGPNSIVATVTDSFGNAGTSAAVVDVLDNVAPTVTITSAAESSKVANQTITGKVVSGGAAAVVGQTVTLSDNGTTVATTTVRADGTFSANVALLAQGTNSIVATVTDSFGNTGKSAAVVDTLTVVPSPTVTITSAAEASKNASQTITGTAISKTQSLVTGKTVTLTDNGTTLGTAVVQSNGTFSATVTLPFQGANSIVASVTDANGNTGTSVAVVDTLDNIAPSLAISSAPVPGVTSAQTVAGSVTSGGAAAVMGQAVTLTDNGSTLGSATVQSNGTFSTSVTLPNQANNAILASLTDSFGNTNNSYLATSSSGQIAITAQQGNGIANDLDFTGSITDQNLWFLHSGNNLQIDILGSSTSVTVNNWFSTTSPDQLQEIMAGGLKIDSQVSQLVQAMATYSANNPGFNPTSSGSSAPSDPNLQSAIAAAWHS